MLNSDMALKLNLEGELNSQTGAVSCGNACPVASTLTQVEAYANNNGAFLNDFRDAFMKMLSVGLNTTCSSFPCWVGSGDEPTFDESAEERLSPPLSLAESEVPSDSSTTYGFFAKVIGASVFT